MVFEGVVRQVLRALLSMIILTCNIGGEANQNYDTESR